MITIQNNLKRVIFLHYVMRLARIIGKRRSPGESPTYYKKEIGPYRASQSLEHAGVCPQLGTPRRRTPKPWNTASRLPHIGGTPIRGEPPFGGTPIRGVSTMWTHHNMDKKSTIWMRFKLLFLISRPYRSTMQ